MSESFDPREAGRQIREAYSYLREVHRNIDQLLRTADTLFGESEPPLTSTDSYVTWAISCGSDNYKDRMPRRFVRLWKPLVQDKTPEAGDPWSRAFALHVGGFIDGRVPEPQVGCFLLTALSPNGLKQKESEAMKIVEAVAKRDGIQPHWEDGLKDRAFGWSDPQDKKLPIKACGYFLWLTDIQSADDIKQLVVDPLVALDAGWDRAKLPLVLLT